MNSDTSHAYDAADIVDNDNFSSALERFIIVSSLWLALVNIKKVPAFTTWF